MQDSLLSEKRSRRAQSASAGKRASAKGRDGLPADSMLSGPVSPDSLAAWEADSAHAGDSMGRAALPKRYEQRIFRGADRSVFSSAAGAAGRSHLLGPGDEISVSLWGDKEKEYNLVLNAEGKVFLEGVGVVQLAGNNLDAASQLLKGRLAKVYSGIGRGTTRVDLTLEKAGPIRIFVLGEVTVPGGYVLSGNASALSALYFARGPSDIGTVRNLQLTRAGTKYSLDLYSYLIRGEAMAPHSLQDGDILFAARAEALVAVEGDVGRPATYELKKGEGVKELLEFAGGLNPTAASHKLTVLRILEGGEPRIIDLASPREYLSGKAKTELRDGDLVKVAKSTEPGKGFLTITGPVMYPGTYESTGIVSVSQLMAKAGGMREDAYLGRVHVVRFNVDGSSQLMAFSLDSVVLDTITLQPRDNVILYSLKDMYLPDSVEVAGAVFKPGKYEFSKGMTVKDVVMQAGGFLPNHEAGRIMVFRGSARERKVDQVVLTVADGLDKSEPGFALQPNDFVQVPVDPKWYNKEIVTLGGLFLHPGKYALLYPGEKLSSLIERAGGFKDNAYIKGGRFFRTKDSVGRVGVDIDKAIRSPRSKSNLALVGGDSIHIPERLNTVKVIGEVGFETSVMMQDGASVQYYIDKAGGYTRRSEKDRVVVQYANGETSRDGYFNRKPDAGSVIYVPQGPEPKPIDWVSGVNALLGTLGVATAVILSIQAISSN